MSAEPGPTKILIGLALASLIAALAASSAALFVAEYHGLGVIGLFLALASVSAAVMLRGRRRLRSQKMLLDVAVNNITQGLCMFDGAGRLLLSNERYLEIYGLDPDRIKPGCTLRDLLVYRGQAGTFSGDPDVYVAERMAQLARGSEASELTFELNDGRTIRLLNRPIPGGGWVATHEDITELRKREKELATTRRFLELIIDNVPAAISVKDASELRYILINRAGEEIYGVPREQMLGKTMAEMFPSKATDVITARDMQVIESRTPLAYGDTAYDSPTQGRRVHLSRRVPVIDENGEVQYLLLVIQDVTEQKQAEARIAHLALHDPLTDLPNRVAFNERLAAELERARGANEKLAVLCVDLDRFKDVNDVFGHAAGDDLLRLLSERLSGVIDGAFFARLGGDEFALIVTDQQLPARAAEVADRLLAAVAEPFQIQGRELHVRLSIGISIFPSDSADQTALLANAAAALHRAKAEGRGSIRFFEADMDRSLRERRALTHELRAAIERDELKLHYQPLARIDGEIVAFEALARWQHPVQGLLAPGVFIPLAEESGLITDLGEWVLREACREAASWPKPLRISVNLSPAQFHHGDLVGMIHAVLLETGLAPARLELEVTESVLVDDFSRAVSILRRLKALGLKIAMDDFGTGYSSLQNLQSFPFDKLKIDRSFINNLETNPQSSTIVRAVIGLGRGLNVPVLAEGVETDRQLEFLAAETCDEVQGYLIGRPQPIEDYAAVVGRTPAAPTGRRRRAVA
ncbi:MAG TPA: EAL domain-containing protein [Xanthobacteraceae bacterium]|nr:EAL domain-containing protein [Xanthobacteraceae bacterium]